MQEALAFHLLNRLPGCGTKTIRRLAAHFGSATTAWNAPVNEWLSLDQSKLKEIAENRSRIDISSEATLLEHERINVIPFTDPHFPKLLTEIPDAPALLYSRGNFHLWQEKPLIAIVGSRNATNYGKQVTKELVRGLVQAGFGIVSGLAFGIDACAHEATIEVKGGTIAVLGSGINDHSLSPQSHIKLAHEILDTDGALISELAPGTPPSVGTFPARNRIMAGLTEGVIVIEAAEDSGSLITARLALDYNRSVFAVPGSIFSPVSIGTHTLLREGARIVTGMSDILAEIGDSHAAFTTKSVSLQTLSLSPDEEKVYTTLSHEGLHVDKLITIVRLETMHVNTILTKLELAGLIENIGNMQYIRRRSTPRS